MPTDTAYILKTSSFEGPLELLLELVEARKLFINDVSLASVAADYIEQVRARMFSLNEVTGFLAVAATLILIKSKSLLPQIALSEEEEQSINDLESRLAKYQILRTATQILREAFCRNELHFTTGRAGASIVFSPHESMTIPLLRSSINEIIVRFPTDEKLPEIAVETAIKLETMIDNLRNRISSALESFSFSSFVKNSGGNINDEKHAKVTVIVSFLAVLELVREGLLDVMQESLGSDISMEKREHAIIAE